MVSFHQNITAVPDGDGIVSRFGPFSYTVTINSGGELHSVRIASRYGREIRIIIQTNLRQSS